MALSKPEQRRVFVYSAALLLLVGFLVFTSHKNPLFGAAYDKDIIWPDEEEPYSRELWHNRIRSHLDNVPVENSKIPQDSQTQEDAKVLENFKILERWCSDFAHEKSPESDGVWHISLFMNAFYDYFLTQTATNGTWKTALKKIGQWQKLYPDSACAPIVEAIYWDAYGYHMYAYNGWKTDISNKFVADAKALSYIDSANAQKILDEHKNLRTINPAWFSETLRSQAESSNPNFDVMLATMKEGLKLYPGYEPIPSAMIASVMPALNKDWQKVDTVIQTAVDQTDDKDKKILYARLYWDVSLYWGSNGLIGVTELFQNSLVNWNQMNEGLANLIAAQPKSGWLITNYASFACRANDKDTYLKLRPRLYNEVYYKAAWPSGYSQEICDQHYYSEKSL